MSELLKKLLAQGFSHQQAVAIAARRERIAKAAQEPPLGPIPQEAINFINDKDLKPSMDFETSWSEEHQTAFTVAGVMEEDILAEFKDSITKALEKGESFQTWKKNIEKTMDTAGWTAFSSGRPEPYRLKTIFNTNMRVARSVGQWQRIESVSEQLPFLEYLLGPSENHRPEHELFAGTIAPVDDPIWNTWMPPNGFGCKCHVRQISAREARSRGITAPEDLGRDSRTGQALEVDEGWDYNPGASRTEYLGS